MLTGERTRLIRPLVGRRRVDDHPEVDEGWTRFWRAHTPGRRELALAGLRELWQTRSALAILERKFVVAAREAHASWREIGEALGVSGQAAHRRFRGVDPVPPRQRDPILAELDALHGPFKPPDRFNTR
jgi:hypothetical protein